jgi:hypothetical protein
MAVVIDSQMASGLGLGSSTQASPLTYSFTNTAGTVLYVFVEAASRPTGLAVTYNGIALTEISTYAANTAGSPAGYVGWWRLLSPATGANNVSISYSSGSVSLWSGAVSLSGNHSTVPEGVIVQTHDNGTLSTSWSSAFTGLTSGSMLLHAVGYGDSGATYTYTGGTKTFQKDGDTGGFTNNIAAEYAASTGSSQTLTISSSGVATSFAAIGLEIVPNIASDLESFRFRNDDGSETTATWVAAQDANATIAPAVNVRIRTLTNTVGDTAGNQRQLEYRKSGSTEWHKVN